MQVDLKTTDVKLVSPPVLMHLSFARGGKEAHFMCDYLIVHKGRRPLYSLNQIVGLSDHGDVRIHFHPMFQRGATLYEMLTDDGQVLSNANSCEIYTEKKLLVKEFRAVRWERSPDGDFTVQGQGRL